MKTIATIATSLLLSVGILAAPASATDKQPTGTDPASALTPCEQAERTASKVTFDLQQAEATILDLLAAKSDLTATNTRLVRKVTRKDARIVLLKEKLARARQG